MLLVLAGCSRSGEQAEREKAELQRAVAESLAEEQAKDRRMHEAAVADAGERIERINSEFEAERAKNAVEQAGAAPAQAGAAPAQAAAAPAQAATAQAQAATAQVAAEALQRYTTQLRQFVADPEMQVRNAALSPKGNGMCAEFDARDRSGNHAGFKRVVVTDTAVNPEEPPNRETMTYFLAFQVAARDTGCFPDVLSVHLLR